MKRRDALCPKEMSLAVLPLVSMASVRLRGSSDWRSNTAIFCGRPSSSTWKSSRVRPPTMAPVLSVTLTQRLTSLASMRNVGPSWAQRQSGAKRRSARKSRTAGLRAMGSLRRAYGDAFGERVSRGPHSAICEGFLLPDGHGFLQGIDQPPTGVEGLRAMRGGDHDQDAGFAHVEAAQAV